MLSDVTKHVSDVELKMMDLLNAQKGLQMDLNSLQSSEAVALELTENALIVPIDDSNGGTSLFLIDKKTNHVHNLGKPAKINQLPKDMQNQVLKKARVLPVMKPKAPSTIVQKPEAAKLETHPKLKISPIVMPKLLPKTVKPKPIKVIELDAGSDKPDPTKNRLKEEKEEKKENFLQNASTKLKSLGTETVEYLRSLVQPIIEKPASTEAPMTLVEEPAENDEDQQIVEAVLKGLQKIAEDTVAMATNVNEGRHGDHDKLTGSIMEGLKTITQDAVQMAQGIEKLNPPAPSVDEPIEQPEEEVDSPQETVAEQQEEPTPIEKDQVDEVKVMKADTDEDGTFMLEEQDKAEPHIAHVIAQVMSMVESGDAFDQLGRQLQILDAGDALMIPLGDEFGQTQLVLLDKQSDSANTLLARVQMHQLQQLYE